MEEAKTHLTHDLQIVKDIGLSGEPGKAARKFSSSVIPQFDQLSHVDQLSNPISGIGLMQRALGIIKRNILKVFSSSKTSQKGKQNLFSLYVMDSRPISHFPPPFTR